MKTGMLHTHTLVVSLYMLQLMVRMGLMMAGNKDRLERFTKALRIPHIVLSVLFLATGIYLLTVAPNGLQPYHYIKFCLIAASIPLGVIGSKRSSMPLTGLGFLLLAGAMTLSLLKPESLRTRSTAVVDTDKAGADMDRIEKGRGIYESKCTLCHGGDGKAGFQGAKDLTVSTMAESDVIGIIRQGKGVMPASDLSEEEVGLVKDFVLYLRK